MIFSFDKEHKVTSRFVQEEYFPAIVDFSSEELNNHFIEFCYKDTDMLEFSVHPVTHTLKRFMLTLCNHYEIKDSSLDIPKCNEGTVSISGPDRLECEIFKAIVYRNGMNILLSSEPADHHFKSGQIIFSFTKENNIAGIILTELSETEITHIKSELKQV